ncbi:MAG: hypothetical protein ACM3N7_09610 [Planctomycetaceae bacterium]
MDCDRRALLKGLGVVLLGFTPFLNACNRSSVEIQPKEEKVQIHRNAQTSSVSRKPTPPIDAAPPGRIETATFALG